jgi:hypothetical protein
VNKATPPYSAELINDNFFATNGSRSFQAAWVTPMKNFGAYHDPGSKVLFASSPLYRKTIDEADGYEDLKAAVETLAEHPNAAPFISRLLIQRLVCSNPTKGYVYRIAQKFTQTDGNLKEVIKAILLDYEARTVVMTATNGPISGKQKEPILRYTQLLRAMGATSGHFLSMLESYGYPLDQRDNFSDVMATIPDVPANICLYRYPPSVGAGLGQSPLASPSVFNWFAPDFNPGGALGAYTPYYLPTENPVAPEMQLTSESQVFSAINYHRLITSGPYGQVVAPITGEVPGTSNVKLVLSANSRIVKVYTDKIGEGKTVAEATAALLDDLDLTLTAGEFSRRYATAPTPNPRSIIIDTVALENLPNPVDRVREVLYLIALSPTYAHLK